MLVGSLLATTETTRLKAVHVLGYPRQVSSQGNQRAPHPHVHRPFSRPRMRLDSGNPMLGPVGTRQSSEKHSMDTAQDGVWRRQRRMPSGKSIFGLYPHPTRSASTRGRSTLIPDPEFGTCPSSPNSKDALRTSTHSRPLHPTE